MPPSFYVTGPFITLGFTFYTLDFQVYEKFKNHFKLHLEIIKTQILFPSIPPPPGVNNFTKVVCVSPGVK